jgi:hypothetical protein
MQVIRVGWPGGDGHNVSGHVRYYPEYLDIISIEKLSGRASPRVVWSHRARRRSTWLRCSMYGLQDLRVWWWSWGQSFYYLELLRCGNQALGLTLCQHVGRAKAAASSVSRRQCSRCAALDIHLHVLIYSPFRFARKHTSCMYLCLFLKHSMCVILSPPFCIYCIYCESIVTLCMQCITIVSTLCPHLGVSISPAAAAS